MGCGFGGGISYILFGLDRGRGWVDGQSGTIYMILGARPKLRHLVLNNGSQTERLNL